MSRSGTIGLLAVAVVLAATLASSSNSNDNTADHSTHPRSRAYVRDGTPTPAPPRVTASALNRQDHTGSRQRQAEGAAHERRPLLRQLPLTRSRVTIDIDGLTRDGRHTRLSVHHPHQSRAVARAVYRRALRTAGDRGRAYRPRYRP